MNELDIFSAAAELADAGARERFLAEACHGRAELRSRIEALLRNADDASRYLEASPQAILDTLDRPVADHVGTQIGPYKLLEQIGEGGMGVVYVAEQTQPVRRRVALKIIKPGMDTKQVIARFEAERQALAMMDHPHIAKVLDAGATDAGRPYFVMELVRGMPITEYCDQERLKPQPRLDLFIDVCHAVQHAHQKGIIHRDLKPSNVMVTLHDGVPVVKVIDFGVAKAVGQQLTERTVYTGLTQLVGTPLYMSPEQAELSGLDIDTRSDVYSLGVLLYELLTGTTPFDKDRLKNAGFDEMRRMIREDEPPRPSTRMSTLGAEILSTISQRRSTDPRRISATLRGELDWIAMKALEKDRGRRYESASALAADIQRFLSDEPVLACPPTAMYRFQKFARKHKGSLTTAAAIAVCLLLGTTVSAWQAVRAKSAEAKAEANAQKADDQAKEATQERDAAQKQRDEVKTLADKLAAKDQQLERTLYAAHMNLAHNAFEAGAPARLRELLAQHRPQPGEADLRGFEWHYLNRLGPADLLVLKHIGRVHSVAYSPDGQRLATTSQVISQGTSEDILTVWDAQTGDKLFSHQRAGGGGVSTVTFSPDGKRLASSAKIWDAETGQELLSLTARATALPAFSPDGKRLATGSGSGQIILWDAQTGELLLTLQGHSVRGQIRGLAFSPDGKRLASASIDKTVKLWDTESGQPLKTLQHADDVFGVAYSPDGKRVASATVGKMVTLWDPLSGDEIRTLRGHTALVFSVAFSPDGKRLASASADNTVKVWDVESGDELFALQGHTRPVWSVAFSPDGQRLASASEDGTVKVREAKAVQKALVLGGGPADVSNVAFSPDGKRLTSVELRVGLNEVAEAKVWDTQTGEKLLAFEGGGPALSPDGRWLAGGMATIMGPIQAGQARLRPSERSVWDLLTGEKLHTIPKVPIPSSSPPSFALSPNGNRFVITRRSVVTIPRPAVTPEGKVCDAKTGQEICSLKGPVDKMVFSPDGKRLAGTAEDGTLKLWDAQTGDEILSFKGAASKLGSREASVAFSYDGKRIGGRSDEAAVAKVWDTHTGEELLSLKGHSGAITRVAFSPDNKRLATTSSDATIKVWDSQTGQEILTLAGHSGRDNGVAFSPDGHRLAAGGPGGTVLIYDATPLPEKP